MPYLIDGHNVIAQMGIIRLDDPDDEAKLVLLLRRFTANEGKKAHVVFDGGIPGGTSPLSTTRVQVYFAAADSSADNVLRMMIRNATNPSSWTLISSDQAIVSVARRKGLRCVRAERFAQRLEAFDQETTKAEDENAVPTRKAEPRLSKSEVDEWLDIFGDE